MKDKRITHMPVSIRLGEEGEATLERWISEGRFKTKADAIRAALNTFERIQEAKEDGCRVLSIREEDLEKLQDARNLVIGMEIA